MTAIALRPPLLSERKWQLLEALHRYKTQTLDLLQLQFPDQSRDAIRTQCDRLKESGWTAKTELEDRQPCYALGTRGQRWFGHHFRKGFPFGKEGLLEHLGIATFCALAQHRRLLPAEFTSRFPDCHRRGLPAQSYCADLKHEGRLVWVLVDHASRADRFHGKLLKVIARRLPLPGFQELVRSQAFRLVILTATDTKAKQIRQVLADRPPLTVGAEVIAIPGLLQFLW